MRSFNAAPLILALSLPGCGFQSEPQPDSPELAASEEVGEQASSIGIAIMRLYANVPGEEPLGKISFPTNTNTHEVIRVIPATGEEGGFKVLRAGVRYSRQDSIVDLNDPVARIDEVWLSSERCTTEQDCQPEQEIQMARDDQEDLWFRQSGGSEDAMPSLPVSKGEAEALWSEVNPRGAEERMLYRGEDATTAIRVVAQYNKTLVQ